MRAWWVVFVAACGRSGFDDPVDAMGPPDYVPEPVDWTDFTNQSTSQTITGTNLDIELELQASFATGMPTVEYRLSGSAYVPFSPSSPATVMAPPGATLQFRVRGSVGDAAFITVTNRSTGGNLLDTVRGSVTTLVTGAGTLGSPFTAPTGTPTDCDAFLSSYPEQKDQDGVYRIVAPTTAYCDMSTDGGGWTLVARVPGTSSTHVTAAAVGTLTDPAQATTAKLSDTVITGLGYTRARFSIATIGAVYVSATTIDLSGTAFQTTNAASITLAGPYTFNFVTTTTCNSDCGVAVINQMTPLGKHCGYRYYASSGNPRNGMGCQDNSGKDGTVWVK